MKLALPSRSILAFVSACMTLGAVANANTWIVDINNGAGANFTQLNDAVLASAAGDVIIVRPGAYTRPLQPFWINKGITIIGQGVVNFVPTTWPDVDVRSVPAGETFTAINLCALGWRVAYCQGSVTIRESKATRGISVVGCADVRIQAMLGAVGGIVASSSRVEIADCTLQGSGGNGGQPCNPWMPAGDGSPGLSVGAGSLVHLARSSAFGGDGGSDSLPGDGGAGVAVLNSELWIDGDGIASIKGGVGGWSDGCTTNFDGNCGPGLVLSGGAVIRSGVTLLPTPPPIGSNGVAGAALVLQNGAIEQVVTPDSPTLQLSGNPVPGGSVTLTVHASPGSVVRLNLGATPQVLASPTVLVEQLLIKSRSFDLGTVPLSGVLTKVVNISPLSPLGYRMFAQARPVFPWNGEVRRTASALLVVR